MPPRKKQINPVAASGTGVARTLASLLRVPALETVFEVCDRLSESDAPDMVKMLVADVVGLYPWTTDVANGIMSYKPGKNSDLVDHLRSHPDQVWVLKDTQRAGKDAIWLATAAKTRGSYFMRTIDATPIRGIFHTVSDELGTDIITAIQLSSCHLL